MRLESALFSSTHGLNAHGDAMAVVGDNVSNANTTAYKASEARFSEILSEGFEGSKSDASPVSGNGVEVSAVHQDTAPGVIEFTNRPLDTAIDGDGYFLVGDPEAPSYSRNGNFIVDENGLLSMADGTNVLGFTGTGTEIGTLDMVNIATAGTVSSEITINGNLNATDDVTEVPDAPATFSEIGQAANFVTSVTAYDSLGSGHDISLAFFKTEANTWTAQAYIDGGEVGGVEGVPVQVGANTVLNFGPNGQLAEANAVVTGTPAYGNGAEAGNFTIDLNSFTQFSGISLTSAINQDGEGAGSIAEYEVRQDGSIFALLTSGSEALVGRLPLADFNNPQGLARSSGGIYSETNASGEATIGDAGGNGFGQIQGGSLERSNVDLANEFTDIVIYQRGYQASSQVFSTTGDMLRDTINLIR